MSAYRQNILLQMVFWHFFEVPKEILKAWRNFLLFNLHYFSIPLLFKTFFSPWKRYQEYYGRGFNLGRFLETFFANLIFRILGAIMRTFLIIIGLLIEVILIVIGFLAFLGWFILPLVLILVLILGFRMLFI